MNYIHSHHSRWKTYTATIKTAAVSSSSATNDNSNHILGKDDKRLRQKLLRRSCSKERSQCPPKVKDCTAPRHTLSTRTAVKLGSLNLRAFPRFGRQLDIQKHHQTLQHQHLCRLQPRQILGHSSVFEGISPSCVDFSASSIDFLLIYVVFFLLTFHAFVLLITASFSGLIGMGNEGSAPSSEESTPISEYPSMYSIHSRVRSSVESTRAPSPMEAPEPDLSHLTPDEIAQIRSVMERARNMQQEDSTMARKLEEEYIDFATKIEREASLSDLGDAGLQLCPICNKAELPMNEDGSRSSMSVCVDCEKMTCEKCGRYHMSTSAKIQEWVCTVCEKRRRLMMTTGMWYHGYHPESELPLERHIIGSNIAHLEKPETQMTSSMDTSMTSSFSQTSSRGSRESRSDSDHTGEGRDSSWEGSRCGGDSGLSMELSSLSAASSQNSEFAKQVYEQNKMKGILMYMMGPCGPGATLPKSESDEFSDLTSDLDFDELASERSRPDGGSSTDESSRDAIATSVSNRKEAKRQKHRPKSLNLSRSHSHTSSDEEDEAAGAEAEGARAESSDKTSSSHKVKTSSSTLQASATSASSTQSVSISSADQKARKPPPLEHSSKNNSREVSTLHDLIDSHAVNSPTPPRSPSWREGLESPPFSPRRRDSYPGKRRGSLSPKEKKNHFTYTDISPPSRQLSLDELYGESSGNGSALENGVAGSHAPQKPSPMSPDEIKDSFVTTMGEPLVFDLPTTRAKPPTSIPCSQAHHNDFHPVGTMSHSAPVMDLATYAATIANSTASLTSMSVSPTNLLPHSSHMGEPLSPDSVDSADSSCSSPVSPGYYDNATPSSDEVEEVELADPSSKSIDFQGSKRQKARPPSTDWSPVIDLSPILDVSPSVEEAEQEDMLAKQMEELERQRSRDAEADEEDDDEDYGRAPSKTIFESKPMVPVKKAVPQVIPRIPPPPSAKKLKQQLNEEHDDNEQDENDGVEDDNGYTYSSTLRRCGNCEDISRLGSENSLIKHTSELTAAQRVADDIDIHDVGTDLPFFTCTSQSQTLPHSAPCISTTISAFQRPSRQSGEKQTEEQGSKQLKDFEALITDEIHKIAEDMENIVKRGAADMKPIPPPKPKRRLPDPELASPPGSKHSFESAEKRPIPSIRTEEPSDVSAGSREGSFEETSSGRYLPRQDSAEKKKAKDLKAKPSPILIQHIEAEEQSVSPHYKVMESPPTPETKTVKREFSDSTSVSPNSSPDQDVYAFPSPVTPPDSDSSPPKPHSPSSPGTDFDEEASARGEEAIRSPYGASPHRVASPYDNTKPTHAPRTLDSSHKSLHTVAAVVKADQHTRTSTDAEVVVRPPISPRRSIRKFEEHKINGGSSPLYENVKDLTPQEYLQEQQKNASLYDDSNDAYGLQKGHGKIEAAPRSVVSQYAVQPTEIFTYPVVGEFPARSRSSSAPAAELQQLSQQERQQQRPEVPARPRSASVDQEQGAAAGERTASVRDKIRAFEEPPIPRKRITRGPKEPPPPQHEPRKEPRKEAHVMKDKRTDSGSSTSSSGSSAKTSSSSSSRSSSDAGRPHDKDSSKDGKKVRRKLPPIPVGEDPVLVPKSKSKRAKPPAVKRGEVVDQDDSSMTVVPGVRPEAFAGLRTTEMGYFVGPSNRTQKPPPRESEDTMNEDDMEVARLTTMRDPVTSPKRKTHLADTGKSKSLDSDTPRARDEGAEGGRVKPPMQRTASLGHGPKDETDEIIDSLINIYGIPCTEAMKCLKKRLQEELRRVTKDRKRKLEELEEIRALQMQIGALKLESDAYARSRAYAGKRSPAQYLQVDSQQQESRKRGTVSSASSSSLTPRPSPQVNPRRQRHKRQSSDPMISKFSPIKEDKDIEADFQTRVHEPSDSRSLKYHTDDSSQSGVSDSESTRSEPIRDSHYSTVKMPDYSRMFYSQKGGSAERLQYSDHEQSHYGVQPLSGSRSEQQLSSRSRTSVFYSDDEESRAREEKKLLLQYEIMKRKQQLEETARLKSELLKLARARQSLAHSYDDIPRQYGSPVAPHRPVPRGIIKPIDDESSYMYDLRPESGKRSREHSRDRSRERSRERMDERDLDLGSFRDDALDSMVMSEHRGRDRDQRRRHHSRHQPPPQDPKALSNYSSTEYLAHKQEARRYIDEPTQYGSQGWIAGDYPSDGLASTQTYSQPSLNKRTDSAQSLATARREALKKDAGIVSSVTLPNIYANRGERDFRPPYRDPNYISTSISDTDGSPASDVTPAMPLLDDVKAKSRTIIRNIGSGSRPVSAEFSAGEVEDLLNAMYRVESDNSVDADEPIMKHMMEGGVTILKQIDRKRRPAPVEPHRYEFPVKRILVTRDAKDKSITGNGLGMKIVGGKEIPGTNDIGAFVTAIYPIIADQLHGELDIGDQVLEWNGIHLTGLSAEDVQDIISQTNGEIEMVVRAQMVPVSLAELAAQPESCRSSYDNLAMPQYEESVKEPPLQRPRAAPTSVSNNSHNNHNSHNSHNSNNNNNNSNSRQGVDPRQLAAQLEGIREAASPAENSPSSSHQDVATTSVSSPCSTPRSDPTSTSSDRQQRPPSSSAATGSGDRADRNIDRHSSDRHSGRRRRRHSPNPEKSQQQHQQQQSSRHSQRQHYHHHHHHHQQHHHHQPSSPPPQEHQQQPPQQSPARSHTPSQQHRQQQRQQPERQPNIEVLPPERAPSPPQQAPPPPPPSKQRTERRKQQETPVLPASTVSDKPHPPIIVDQPDDGNCSSPALNDRLRASPPLDTRRSMKSRASKKGKDNFVFTSKAPPEVEKGEDFGLGEIQLQISHDDFDNTLNIHVIQARNLRPRDLNGLSDPFVKLYLLPGRGPENKRRTKHIPRTLNPEWHQTVMFQDVARLELQNKVLEITVWDYDRFKANDFLGELIIELREFAFLDNKPHWYPLKEHVTMQSFELPKSTVAPPKPVDNGRPKSKSPRHGKKHGVSSLRPQESTEQDGENGQRRRSLGAITGNGANETAPARQVSSATNSPLFTRRPRGSKSPIKTKSNGLLYR